MDIDILTKFANQYLTKLSQVPGVPGDLGTYRGPVDDDPPDNFDEYESAYFNRYNMDDFKNYVRDATNDIISDTDNDEIDPEEISSSIAKGVIEFAKEYDKWPSDPEKQQRFLEQVMEPFHEIMFQREEKMEEDEEPLLPEVDWSVYSSYTPTDFLITIAEAYENKMESK